MKINTKSEMHRKWRLHREKLNRANVLMEQCYSDMLLHKKKSVSGGIMHYIKRK